MLQTRPEDRYADLHKTIHVGDLKIAGEHAVVQGLLKIIEQEFGELTIERGTFTNCGVQHIQNPMTREITLDQIDFLSKLHTIEHPQLATGTNEDKCIDTLHQLFMSLLGAIAYATHTRVDVMVFIVAMQRQNHSPEVQHVRKLNKLLRWVQRNPKKLSYNSLPSKDSHLRIISDAAFKKDTERDIVSGERCTSEPLETRLSLL